LVIIFVFNFCCILLFILLCWLFIKFVVNLTQKWLPSTPSYPRCAWLCSLCSLHLLLIHNTLRSMFVFWSLFVLKAMLSLSRRVIVERSRARKVPHYELRTFLHTMNRCDFACKLSFFFLCGEQSTNKSNKTYHHHKITRGDIEYKMNHLNCSTKQVLSTLCF